MPGQDRRVGWSFVLPALAILAVTVVFPVVYTAVMSLTRWSASSLHEPEWAGAANYVQITLGDARFWHALLVTGYFSGVAVTAEVILGVALAQFLNRPFAAKGLVQTLLLLPVAGTPAALALVWRNMYNPSYGILNWFLVSVGLPPQRWLFGPQSVLPSLILMDVWQWTPFVALIVLTAMMALPTDPLEAAIVDGASPWQVFWTVTLPMVRPSVVAAAILRLIDALKTFDQIFITTQGGPGTASQTLVLYIFDQAFRYFNFGYASALIMVLVAVILGSNMLLIRWRKGARGEAA
ncbi:MAG: sugar ABC transporter permease [Armatimonadota bacterium]|nr:sugar ABC transporter permease [Armatimonadota bacterium]MDR7486361.1 sugar ABC transporter permease [Armatimonadota bacterium]MDR7534239.1 sugar ABC transporter permease [Armatimonadota bacterium]MDR7536745.1 sugar ABC transporter permease [Armatimonadota bacterium]